MNDRRVYKNRKDSNHAETVAAFRAAGAVVIDCTGDIGIGFDILVAYRGRLIPVEIKDGNKPPSARRLTLGEQARQAQLADAGVTMEIVSNLNEVAEILTSVT